MIIINRSSIKGENLPFSEVKILNEILFRTIVFLENKRRNLCKKIFPIISYLLNSSIVFPHGYL